MNFHFIFSFGDGGSTMEPFHDSLPAKKQPYTVTKKMVILGPALVFILHGLLHHSNNSEHEPKRGNLQLLVALGFCSITYM